MTNMAPTTSYEWPIPIETSGQIGILTASGLCIFISSLFVGSRLFAKRYMSRALDWSDYCIMAAWLFCTGLHIDNVIMVHIGGFGFHVADIVHRFGPNILNSFYKSITAFPILWNVCICFSKISVLLMYTAIIPVRNLVWPARMLGGIIILWNVGGVIAAFALCRPFSYNWDKTIDGHCGSQPLYYTGLGIVNVITDVFMLVLPLPFFYKLQMQLQKKILLIGMFSVGFITCAITIYRQTTLLHLDFADMTYSGVVATVFSGIEPTVAICLACVSFLRPLFGKDQNETPSSHYTLSQIKRGVFSKKTPGSSSNARTFVELDDDLSEVQLQPVESDANVHIPPDTNQQNDIHDRQPKAITVQTQWDVNYQQEMGKRRL